MLKIKYQVVGEGSDDLMSDEQFKTQFGHRFTGLRSIVTGEPKVRDLLGPFYDREQDGFQVIRYETWAVYEALSN
jgi:hypothetical protein